jgi:hypothetical protein
MPARRLLFVLPVLLSASLAFGQVVTDQPVKGDKGDKGPAQPPEKKITDKMQDHTGTAEVRFTDESIVRMVMLQDKLEVVTKYGKLTVPMTDIVKIDFGIHIPEDLEKKILQAIEDLGNENYKTREAAVKDLVTWGPYAYPQVVKASKSDLPEVQKRATLALDKIKAKYSARALRTREEDVIVTPNFTVVGKIVTQTVRAKAENFGELDLQLTKLRSVRSLSAMVEAEVTLDAAKYGIGNNVWLDTNYEIRQGMRFLVTANGNVNLWPQNGGFTCGPDGFDQNGGFGPRGQMLPGSLIGRIGENGPQFLIGSRHEGTADREGKLYLSMVPSPWQRNGSIGSYTVKITPKSEFE